VEWIQEINQQFNTSLAATVVYDYPSLREFSKFVETEINKGNNQTVSGPFISLSSGPLTNDSLLAHKPVSQSSRIPNQTGILPMGLQEELIQSLAKTLSIKENEITANTKFTEIGLDSIISVEWIQAINQQYGTSLAAAFIYNYPTIRDFVEFFGKEINLPKGETNQNQVVSNSAVSVHYLIQQVQQGVLDIEQADQLLHQLYEPKA